MSSKRRRLGVALVLDRPVADEVDGLRRALGDPSLGRIPAHLTLVPPVNVRPADLPAALTTLRRAAATQAGPLRLTLGPATTFLPANPVLYLAAGGDLRRLRNLRDAVFVGPLERTLTWPWVPHVTIADGIEEDRVRAAAAALDRYAVVADIDRIVLLEEQDHRVWRPIADVLLDRPAVVGTGGLALEISAGRLLDPEALGLIAGITDGAYHPDARPGGATDPPFHSIVMTGRRQGVVVGVATAMADHLGAGVGVLVRSDVRREGVGSHLLAHLEMAAKRAGWPYERLAAVGPPGFYRSRSAWSVPTGD